MVEDIISSTQNTEFDRCHFVKLGDFAIEYEIVYYLDSPEYGVYMDRKHQINLAIKELFEKEGIEFSHSTQRAVVEK